MDHAYTAATIEMDRTGYDDLASQINDNKGARQGPQDIRNDVEAKEAPKPTSSSKKYVFKRGDEVFEIDDDFELEMTADKRPVRMSLREIKDRAAGDVAVKNRMHALAEEKKRVQGTFKEFADLAKKDPLSALEFISSKANEADSEFEYQKYIEKLAEQAEKLGSMDEKDRKIWEQEKKLSQAEENLSRKERTEAVVLRKQQILSEYPEIGDSEFGQIVDSVLNSDELLEGLETEHDVMNRAEELIQEILTQRDLIAVISDINPAHVKDNTLIFSLSDQLRQNPDLDEQDVRDIVRDLIGEKKAPVLSERDRDVRTLSEKQRQAAPVSRIREQNSDPYKILEQQLLERKEQFRKTPLTKR